MRNVGVLFKKRGGRTAHISQGKAGLQFYSICEEAEGFEFDQNTDVAQLPICKKCRKSAESIAEAIGFYTGRPV